MTCEMCGKEDAPFTARVEGVEMTLCSSCSRHGTILQKPSAPARKSRAPRREAPPEEDSIEMVRDGVGRLLRAHRERNDLTQEAFARKLNLKLSSYQHYENDDRKPDIGTARALERVIAKPLVIRVKTKPGPSSKSEASGMTIGDLMKRG